MFSRALVVPLGCLALLSAAEAHGPTPPPDPAAAPNFVAPAPGSYVLHSIMRAPDGEVLDTDGKARRLSAYTTGQVTLLSLIYTQCSDANGCPLALTVLHLLKQRIEHTPAYQGKVRFVSLSLDPKRDTPQVLHNYAHDHESHGGGVPWHFLTTRSSAALAPLLEGFGQDLSVALDQDGGGLSHTLKMFLIDARGRVREIYTTSFLVPDVMMNDIGTLLLESRVRRK